MSEGSFVASSAPPRCPKRTREGENSTNGSNGTDFGREEHASPTSGNLKRQRPDEKCDENRVVGEHQRALPAKRKIAETRNHKRGHFDSPQPTSESSLSQEDESGYDSDGWSPRKKIKIYHESNTNGGPAECIEIVHANFDEEHSVTIQSSSESSSTTNTMLELRNDGKIGGTSLSEEILECGCCYEAVPRSDMVGCKRSNHLFCTGCVCNLAKHRVFGEGKFGLKPISKDPATELMCMLHGGCDSGFHLDALKRVLSPATYTAYLELQTRLERETRGETLSTCPKCEHQDYLPNHQREMECSACKYESCRSCGRESHEPMACEEFEQERQTDLTQGRKEVEEAITRAKIRSCPLCRRKYIKEFGCNEMKCSCGTKFCYICQQPVFGSSHYGRGRCKMFTNNEEDDARAMREAGVSTVERIRRTGGEIEVDVDAILSAGASTRRRTDWYGWFQDISLFIFIAFESAVWVEAIFRVVVGKRLFLPQYIMILALAWEWLLRPLTRYLDR